MGGKKMIIIAISLIAVGLLAYFIFFNGKSEEDDSLQSSYNGSKSSKSSRKNKKTNSNNAQFSNGVSAQSDIVNSQQSDSQSQSFQSENSKSKSQGYFGSRAILQQNQLDGNGGVGNAGVNSIDYSGGDSSSGGGGSGGSSGGASSGGGSSSAGGGTSTYPARLQSCIAALQPVLNAKSTDTTTITNSLLNVMGFSMLPVETQSEYINSIVRQSKGTSAENYCKTLLQTVNPQAIDVASLYTNCTTMVKNLYSQKGSNTTESDVINAFASLGIMNGATTYAQQKTVLQNYLGGEYSSVITAMSNLNSVNLTEQSNVICSKTSSGIVNAVNGSSAYLSCITTVNSAKTNKITNVATALTSYQNLSVANQTLMTAYYKDFLSGTRTAEFICAFLSKNAIFTQSAAKTALSDMVLSSSTDINTSCGVVVNAIKSEYNDYLSNSDIDYVANVVKKIDPYEFLMSDTSKANIIKYLITQKITDANFNTLSANNQARIAKRLYETNYSLSAFANPAVGGIYTELFPQLCKCSHIDFDDMAWKDVFVSYIILKQGGTTAIPENIVQKQAFIVSSNFYRKCYAGIQSTLSDIEALKMAIPSAANWLTGLGLDMKSFTNMDMEFITSGLKCIAKKKCNYGEQCPQSCSETVDSICTRLTLEYFQRTPTAINMNTLFTCPQTDSGTLYDTKICYNLTEAQRINMAQNFYDTILAFKNTASDIRKTIIQNLWKIHSDKQKSNNTSVSSSQCVEQANNYWHEFLKPYSAKDTTPPK